ncbi:Rv0361 family membrane protein [Rhodococcoides fascians]|uniref:Rv0361 family membrane protein n=1 Tax=Rhodococcoides fascians TaxID=1828 RepID=UPI00056C8138|nr:MULTISPECIES: hypothetical protein [Rhodococcus]OZC91240.1 hypothetical protein CH282_02335 [Rhodococcus sp. 06-418-1B]
MSEKDETKSEPDTSDSTPTPPKLPDATPQDKDATPQDKKDAEASQPDASEAETTAIPTVEPPVRPAPRPHAVPQRIPARGEVPRPAQQPAGPSTARPTPQPVPQQTGPRPQPSGRSAGSAPARKTSKRWLGALAAAVVVIVAVGAAAFFYLARDGGENSPEAQIRTSVTSFTEALASGDLATLRSSSCGDLATYYRDIPDAEFADVHRVAVEQGNVPVMEGIDAVQITGDTAIAQIIAYTEANPNERSPRTFDLRLEDETWKVC